MEVHSCFDTWGLRAMCPLCWSMWYIQLWNAVASIAPSLWRPFVTPIFLDPWCPLLQVVRVSPNDPDAWFMLASTRLSQNKVHLAHEAVQHHLHVNPQDRDARKLRQEIKHRLKEL